MTRPAAPLGFPVAPMKAVLGSLPTGDGWAFEVKWDGYRTIAHVAEGRVRLQSTAGHDVTDRWPELAGLADAVNAPTAILDGELVALDDDGHPDFGLIAETGRGGRRQAVLFLFDVLSIGGVDTIELPYEDRRRLLADLVEPGDNWQVPDHRVDDGAAFFSATSAQGLEGVVAKRLGSRYRPGTRTRDWRKVKHRRRLDVRIGGFTAGTGNRASTFGALLVGLSDDEGRLRFAGGVGTGFDTATLHALRRRLDALATDACPFDPPPSPAPPSATWVEARLAATIEIAEITNDGLVRQASFVELRP